MRQYSLERLALIGRQVPRPAQLGAQRETRRFLQAWRRTNVRGMGPRNLDQECRRRREQITRGVCPHVRISGGVVLRAASRGLRGLSC